MHRTVVARLTSVFFHHPILSTACFELILLVSLGVVGYYNPGNLGTLIALALCYVVFPLLALAFVLWVWAGFKPGPRRSGLQTPASLCFLTPIVAVRVLCRLDLPGSLLRSALARDLSGACLRLCMGGLRDGGRQLGCRVRVG
jgi:hypothetical protein